MEKEIKEYIQTLIQQQTEELKNYIDSKIESAIENLSDYYSDMSELIDSVLQSDDDACSKLNYFSQGHFIDSVEYTLQPNNNLWNCECYVGGKQMGTGSGKSKKEAKEIAAKQCIKALILKKAIKK